MRAQLWDQRRGDDDLAHAGCALRRQLNRPLPCQVLHLPLDPESRRRGIEIKIAALQASQFTEPGLAPGSEQDGDAQPPGFGADC